MIRHVGFILDGNRRFARKLMRKPWQGHVLGLQKARQALCWACEAGIKYITAYVLSLENLHSRPASELRYILRYVGMECDAILTNQDHPVHKNKVQVRFIGRTQLLPAWLRKKLSAVERATATYHKHVLNVALAYGGQQELVDAMQKIAKKILKGVLSPAQLNESILAEHLYTNGQPAPDLIIRTGGEKRLSNFLPFQSVYSELIFVEKRWPEFGREDFDAALAEFRTRQRRFGK